jgi:uncharacterized protein YPO0396
MSAADVGRTISRIAHEIIEKTALDGTDAPRVVLLGIPTRGALEVFNQAIGVKEIADIDSFVRKHMLEPSEAFRFIDDHLKPHYKHLDACYQAIQKAKDQIDREKKLAIQELRSSVADLAVEAAARIVQSSLTPDVQRKLVHEFIDTLPQSRS